jgi:GTP-binding protein
VSLRYLVPTRGLLGFRYQFLTATRGKGVMNAIFHSYLPLAGEIPARATGSLVASDPGQTATYALRSIEQRGTLFVGPGVTVYAGMVVGESARPDDLAVNVVKQKHLTNFRMSVKEIQERLSPPRPMSLDEAIEYLADDELLEVTPKSYRLRKAILDKHERGRLLKRSKLGLE